MAIMTEQQARELLTRVLSFSRADECQCQLTGSNEGNIRYARNSVSTSGEVSNVTLAVSSSFGKQTGAATINQFDDASLERVVRRSEELARLAPENPEHMPLLGPQEYRRAETWVKATADVTPEQRAAAAAASINPCRENDLVAAGFINDNEAFVAMMNSKGLFAYNLASNVDFTVTVRTEDGKGSGWATRDFNDVNKLDTGAASGVAIAKAMKSRDAKEMEPGRYTVILEPAASVTLLANMAGAMDQRAADEGRSFMSRKPKDGEEPAEGAPRNRIGEKMFDERVTVYSDPTHPECPTAPFAGDGHAVGRTLWVDKGVVKTLPNSRYWAEKTGVPYVPTAFAGGGLFGGGVQLIMEGGDRSLEEMIADTRRGVLVTRTWYIRQVDPQTLLYTGLTRDGTFYIEDGEIKYPIKNFRFNESPIVMLNNIEELGRPVRINGSMIPPMKLRDFTFSSLSDAV
ncbi:MAG: metallopeptidase TldD-related protein [Gammaproteobacteria bacterium]